MLKITIICLGKFKEKAFAELEKEYLKRLSLFAKVKIVELQEQPYHSNTDLDRIKQKEAEAIQKHIPNNSIVIMLEEKGTVRSSEDFAAFIDRIGGIGQELTFIIGSGVGLHGSLKKVTNYNISLSP